MNCATVPVPNPFLPSLCQPSTSPHNTLTGLPPNLVPVAACCPVSVPSSFLAQSCQYIDSCDALAHGRDGGLGPTVPVSHDNGHQYCAK